MLPMNIPMKLIKKAADPVSPFCWEKSGLAVGGLIKLIATVAVTMVRANSIGELLPSPLRTMPLMVNKPKHDVIIFPGEIYRESRIYKRGPIRAPSALRAK